MSDYEPQRVGRWMSANVITVKTGLTLFDALEIMQGSRIRHLPVVRAYDNKEVLGMLSNRDVVRAVTAPAPRKGFEPLQENKVDEVMTKPPLHTVTPLTLVREAAETMCREKLSALMVMEGDHLVGIVTSEDLLWALLETTED
jgi:CBS domain-containing protein